VKEVEVVVEKWRVIVIVEVEVEVRRRGKRVDVEADVCTF
jgi:hypothetical protein